MDLVYQTWVSRFFYIYYKSWIVKNRGYTKWQHMFLPITMTSVKTSYDYRT